MDHSREELEQLSRMIGLIYARANDPKHWTRDIDLRPDPSQGCGSHHLARARFSQEGGQRAWRQPEYGPNAIAAALHQAGRGHTYALRQGHARIDPHRLLIRTPRRLLSEPQERGHWKRLDIDPLSLPARASKASPATRVQFRDRPLRQHAVGIKHRS